MDAQEAWVELKEAIMANNPGFPHHVEVNDLDDREHAYVWCVNKFTLNTSFKFYKYGRLFLFESYKDAAFVKLKWGLTPNAPVM